MRRIACLLTVSVCLTLGSVGGSVTQSAAASETKEKGVQLVGVTLSNFRSQSASEAAELPFLEV